jgi:hypothetical protein
VQHALQHILDLERAWLACAYGECQVPEIPAPLAIFITTSVRPTPRECLFPVSIAAPVFLPQTVSAGMAAAKKASFRAVLRDRLGVLLPERYANSLSEWRSLSGAWESSDLLYKLFLVHHQQLNDLQFDESS